MPEFDTLIYEKPEAGIARIWLNRPEARNAQDTHLLYELNDAFDIAMGDSEVKVVIWPLRDPTFQPVMTCGISIAAAANTNGLAPGVTINGKARKLITAAKRKSMKVSAAAGGIWPNPPSHLCMVNPLPAG